MAYVERLRDELMGNLGIEVERNSGHPPPSSMSHGDVRRSQREGGVAHRGGKVRRCVSSYSSEAIGVEYPHAVQVPQHVRAQLREPGGYGSDGYGRKVDTTCFRPDNAKGRPWRSRGRPASASSERRSDSINNKDMDVLLEICRGQGRGFSLDPADFDSSISAICNLPVGPFVGAAREGWGHYFRNLHDKIRERDITTARPRGARSTKKAHQLAATLASRPSEQRPKRSGCHPPLRAATPRRCSTKGAPSSSQTPSWTAGDNGRRRREYFDGLAASRARSAKRAAEEEATRRMTVRLQTLWQELKIPEPDRAYVAATYLEGGGGAGGVEASGVSPGREGIGRPTSEDVQRELVRQIRLLLGYRDATIKVLRTVRLRETKLAEVEQALQSFQWHRGLDTDAIGLVDALAGLREGSLDVVRAVVEWRKTLWQPRAFCWRGVNYLEKMSRDTLFLRSPVGRNMLASVGLETKDMTLILFPPTDVNEAPAPGRGKPEAETAVQPPPPIVRLTPKAELVSEYRSRFFEQPTLVVTQAGRGAEETARYADLVEQEAPLQQRVEAERARLVTKGCFVPLLRWLPADTNAPHDKRRRSSSPAMPPQTATMREPANDESGTGHRADTRVDSAADPSVRLGTSGTAPPPLMHISATTTGANTTQGSIAKSVEKTQRRELSGTPDGQSCAATAEKPDDDGVGRAYVRPEGTQGGFTSTRHDAEGEKDERESLPHGGTGAARKGEELPRQHGEGYSHNLSRLVETEEPGEPPDTSEVRINRGQSGALQHVGPADNLDVSSRSAGWDVSQGGASSARLGKKEEQRNSRVARETHNDQVAQAREAVGAGGAGGGRYGSETEATRPSNEPMPLSDQVAVARGKVVTPNTTDNGRDRWQQDGEGRRECDNVSAGEDDGTSRQALSGRGGSLIEEVDERGLSEASGSVKAGKPPRISDAGNSGSGYSDEVETESSHAGGGEEQCDKSVTPSLFYDDDFEDDAQEFPLSDSEGEVEASGYSGGTPDDSAQGTPAVGEDENASKGARDAGSCSDGGSVPVGEKDLERRRHKPEEEEEHAAAVRIQRLARDSANKRALHRRVDAGEDPEEESAKKLQAWLVAWRSRRENKVRREKADAAVRIQRTARAKRASDEVKELRRNHEARRADAAVKIQSLARRRSSTKDEAKSCFGEREVLNRAIPGSEGRYQLPMESADERENRGAATIQRALREARSARRVSSEDASRAGSSVKIKQAASEQEKPGTGNNEPGEVHLDGSTAVSTSSKGLPVSRNSSSSLTSDGLRSPISASNEPSTSSGPLGSLDASLSGDDSGSSLTGGNDPPGMKQLNDQPVRQWNVATDDGGGEDKREKGTDRPSPADAVEATAGGGQLTPQRKEETRNIVEMGGGGAPSTAQNGLCADTDSPPLLSSTLPEAREEPASGESRESLDESSPPLSLPLDVINAMMIDGSSAAVGLSPVPEGQSLLAATASASEYGSDDLGFDALSSSSSGESTKQINVGVEKAHEDHVVEVADGVMEVAPDFRDRRASEGNGDSDESLMPLSGSSSM